MASAGQVIRNPVTGETVTFLVCAGESEGRLLRLEMVAAPNAAGAPTHVHPGLTERYDVRAGRLRVRLRGEEIALGPGDRLEIPRGAPHSFRNAEDEPARVEVEFQPAGSFEHFMETVYALARDGKTTPDGTPRPFLRAAVVARRHLDDIALARPPLPVQRVLFGVLAPIGRLRGYRAGYP